MSYELHRFRGAGNALYIKAYIEAEFRPLTWNMAAMKCMKLMVAHKINPTKLDEQTEFTDDILKEIHEALKEREQKGLPIFA